MVGYKNNISFHHMPAKPQIVLPTDVSLTISVKALTYVSFKRFVLNLRKDLNLIFT